MKSQLLLDFGLFAIWMPIGSSKNNHCATLPQGPRHMLSLHEMRNYDVVRNFIFDVDNESVTFLLPSSYFNGVDQPACSLIIEHPPFFGPSLDLTSKRSMSLCGSNVGTTIASSPFKSLAQKSMYELKKNDYVLCLDGFDSVNIQGKTPVECMVPSSDDVANEATRLLKVHVVYSLESYCTNVTFAFHYNPD